MSRDSSFRPPRRRGFDDAEEPSSFDRHDARPSRSFGAPSGPAPQGPAIDATVKWFSGEKGFGFVELGNGGGDAFLHINTLRTTGHETVAPGAKLRVQVGQGPKGSQVTAVLEVDASAAPEAAPRSAPRGGGGGRGRGPVDTSNAVDLGGVVKWFNPDKGFGFVTGADGLKDVFVHISVVEAAGLGSLAEGQEVSMQVVETSKGREAVTLSVAR
jgi:CspA family cold shock protein